IDCKPLLTWRQVDNALRSGLFGLDKASSLAKLLAAERGVRAWSTAPALTEEQILTWADAFRKLHGRWPNSESGRVLGAKETWQGLNMALHTGARGLPKGGSLATLFARHRGHQHRMRKQKLTLHLILAWADEH